MLTVSISRTMTLALKETNRMENKEDIVDEHCHDDSLLCFDNILVYIFGFYIPVCHL